MISVCIPVFNSDARNLALSLKNQAGKIPAEIILIDDGSAVEYRQLNRTLKDQGILYHELPENIGRAGIRNRFSTLASYGHLLFLDCDSVIVSDSFLSDYARALQEHPYGIICGGRIYETKRPSRNFRLHWKYGKRRESRPVQIRMIEPKRSFMTNNFLIPAGVLRDTPFDERISGYGHEDTLFGFAQSKKGREILHIENPVLHGRLESNREFVEKTREAVRNLILITSMPLAGGDFTESVTLLRTVRRFESDGLATIVRTGSHIWVPLSAWLLGRGYGGPKLLDSYKLGLFLILEHRGHERMGEPGISS
jgi:glycosyltransferase involved in cell wall biosynthesis